MVMGMQTVWQQAQRRIDGILKEIAQQPVQLAGKISARLKVMSRLDIAERRVPQDGRSKLRMTKTRSIDFRMSTCPTLFGEKIVLRLLDSDKLMLDLTKLGFEPESLQQWDQEAINSVDMLVR